MTGGIQGRRAPGGLERGSRSGQARTRLARGAVVRAARDLFLECGYAATTMEAISAASDVPAATVYRLFSSKLGILKALLDVSIAGDDQGEALPDRANARALFAEADPARQLSGFAEICRQINTRSAPVYRILISAASADHEAATLLAEYTRQREQGQGQIARSLAHSGALRPELAERDAADIIHALMSPEIYRLLVDERAWSPERYEQWLQHILADQLLA
jgi:AcrR family transcriptional regulator